MNEPTRAGNETALLMIYSPPCWHEEGFLVGNREGLRALQAALALALEEGSGATEVFAADGEGYHAIVVCVEDWDGAARLQDHYTDAPGSTRGEHPASLLTSRRYEALTQTQRKE